MGGMFAFLDNVFIGTSSALPYKIHMTGSFLTLSKAEKLCLPLPLFCQYLSIQN